MRYIIASYRKSESAYGTFLRTGHCPEPVETKHNPNHDPHNGRFTFKAGGNGPAPGARSRGHPPTKKPDGGSGDGGFTGGGGGDFGGGGATGYHMTDDEVRQYQQQHPGKAPYLAQPGDTVASIAAQHHVSEAQLRALNGAGANEQVHPGQIVALPSGSLRAVEKNGYSYGIDSVDCTHEIGGNLQLAEEPERSKANQRGAGGSDRLVSDDGGHFIAARFGGPTDAFNHFAQDASFNRGQYRALEDRWATEVRAGKQVHVEITAYYPGQSRRPDSLTVRWIVNGHSNIRSFSNGSKGKSHGR